MIGEVTVSIRCMPEDLDSVLDKTIEVAKSFAGLPIDIVVGSNAGDLIEIGE